MAGIQAINVAGNSVGFPFLPLYLYQERHLSMTFVGLIILISGLFAAAFQVVGGILADKFGHRRILIVYQILGIITYAFLAILIYFNAPIWSIIILSIVVPVVTGMAFPTVSAIIADTSPKERLAESYALLAIGSNVGWAIGPLAGGYILHFASYAWLFGAAALIYSLSIFVVLRLPTESIRENSEKLSFQSLKSILSNSTLVIFSALCILVYLDMGQWGNTLSVFTVDRIRFSPEQYGWLMTISGILIIVFQYPLARRIEFLGKRKALILGSLLYGAGFLSLSWVEGFVPSVGSIIILVAGEMLFVPTALAVIGMISRPEDRGKNMGFFGLCEALGFSLGPLLGGFLLDTFPSNSLFIWGPIAATSFLAAFGFTIWRHYPTETAGFEPEK